MSKAKAKTMSWHDFSFALFLGIATGTATGKGTTTGTDSWLGGRPDGGHSMSANKGAYV